MILDEAFRPPTSAVDLLIQKLGSAVADIGHHEARVGFALCDLGLVDNLARSGPALGLILEAVKKPHRFIALLGQRRRQLHQRFAECLELVVERLSQNEINTVSVAQVVHLRGAEVRVAS